MTRIEGTAASGACRLKLLQLSSNLKTREFVITYNTTSSLLRWYQTVGRSILFYRLEHILVTYHDFYFGKKKQVGGGGPESILSCQGGLRGKKFENHWSAPFIGEEKIMKGILGLLFFLYLINCNFYCFVTVTVRYITEFW
jgi:hypothetical protein